MVAILSIICVCVCVSRLEYLMLIMEGLKGELIIWSNIGGIMEEKELVSSQLWTTVIVD